MLAVIGEMFEEPNVVGIGMAIRSREDLLSVWNEDNSNDEVIFYSILPFQRAQLELLKRRQCRLYL